MEEGGDREREGPSKSSGERQLDSGWEQVGRATDTPSSPIQDVCVDHRCADVAMTEQFLDGPDVVPIFEQMRCERMP